MTDTTASTGERQLWRGADGARRVLRGGAAAAILCGLVIGPLCYGATEVRSLALLQYLAAGAGLLWVLSASARPGSLFLPGLVLVLGVVQLLPLPQWGLEIASPLAHQADAAARELGVSGTPQCASVDPGRTVGALRQLFLMALIVVVVGDLARHRAFRFAIALTLVGVAAVVLVLGVRFHGGRDYVVMGTHDLSGPIHPWKSALAPPLHTAGYGYTDVVHVGAVSYTVDWRYSCGAPVGPFLVSNHFAAFMNLAVPLALGLLVSMAGNGAGARRLAVAAAVLCAGGAAVLIGSISQSRAGVASLIVGVLLFLCLNYSPRLGRHTVRWLVLGAVCSIVFVGGVYLAVRIGAAPEWLSRVQAKVLEGASGSIGGRIGAWKVAGSMFAGAPLLGTGLGTYGQLFTAFKSSPDNWYFAHNDYAQFAAEAGCAGIALAVLAAVWMSRRILRGWNGLPDAAERAWAAGAAGGLAAFGLHCMFDWNVHVPANALACAVLCGLLLAMVSGKPACDSRTTGTWRRALRWVAPLAIVAVIGACVLGARRTVVADRLVSPLQRAVAQQRVLDRQRSRGDKMEVLVAGALTLKVQDDLLAAIPDAIKAADLVSSRADYAESLGQAYLHLAGGRKSPELMLAADWYRRSLRAFPANRAARDTLEQIERLLGF